MEICIKACIVFLSAGKQMLCDCWLITCSALKQKLAKLYNFVRVRGSVSGVRSVVQNIKSARKRQICHVPNTSFVWSLNENRHRTLRKWECANAWYDWTINSLYHTKKLYIMEHLILISKEVKKFSFWIWIFVCFNLEISDFVIPKTLNWKLW
jgi:hypothetical protein